MSKIGIDIEKAKQILQQDGLVAIPTETVYGLAANALDKDSVLKIFEAKNRPHFVDSLAAASNGRFIPALGGVLIRDKETGGIIGAIGITGDSGENDEAVAVQAFEQCGFVADLS